MTWFKVDDKFHDHRKVRIAGRGTAKRRDAAALGLWVLAGSWSADNDTYGFVPSEMLFRWDDDGEELAKVLVGAQLWFEAERDGETGYSFANWDDWQPTEVEVEAKRAAARERMRRARKEKQRQVDGPPVDVRANIDRTSLTPATNGGARSQEHEAKSQHRSLNPVPTRPDPSRPVLPSRAPDALVDSVDDDGLMRIMSVTGGDEAHARKSAQLVLARRPRGTVRDATAYVLKAIEREPDAFRFVAPPPSRDEECADHVGQRATTCISCAADRKAAR